MKFFIYRPIATSMMLIFLLVLGVYSFFHLHLELVPQEEYPRLEIETFWPYLPAEVIQAEITSPLEGICSSLKGVRKVNSESSLSSSRVSIELDSKVNLEFVRLELKEKIAGIRGNLPYGIKIRVESYLPGGFRFKPFLSFDISGNYSIQELRELVKDKLETALREVKGVSRVEVSGGADAEIKVLLDLKKIKAFGIHPLWIKQRISERLGMYAAGKIRKGAQEVILKISTPLRNLQELEDILLERKNNRPLRVKDVASLSRGYGEVFHLHRTNGLSTLRLTVSKEKGASTLNVAKKVNQKIEEIRKNLPSDIVFKEIDDEAEELKKYMKELYLLGGIIIFVIFCLVFFTLRSLVSSLLILSSIAFSAFISFNFFYFFGAPLNLLTLGGILLGFGIFVDNSIVVYENILRFKEGGSSSELAALHGSREVILPVVASTLTTVSVFFSFAYFQGRLRIYYLPLAIVVASALCASLLVSFTLIPALSSRVKERQRIKKERSSRTYEKVLKVILKYPLMTLVVFSLIFYLTYKWFKAEVTIGQFFKWQSNQELEIYIAMPQEVGIEEIDKVVRRFEKMALLKDYVKEVKTTIFFTQAYLRITFPPRVKNSLYPYLLKEELIQLATSLAGIDVSISGLDPKIYFTGFNDETYFSSRITFSGYNLKKLRELTSSFVEKLKKYPRVVEVKLVSDGHQRLRSDSSEYVLKMNKQKMRWYGLDPLDMYFQLNMLFEGKLGEPLRMQIGREEISVFIGFEGSTTSSLNWLQGLLLKTEQGKYIRIRDVFFPGESILQGSIHRENQKFKQTVRWEFKGPQKIAEEFKRKIYSQIELPPGFTASLEEEKWITEEEKKNLSQAFIFSLALIFMVLAALYESLIQPIFILFAVPFSLIGVFSLFALIGSQFDSAAYVGLILLGGIVVNNSILLVNHINLKRAQGLSLEEAVVKGASERIRPIFLTTGTTVLGMLPILFIHLEVGSENIWFSLALTTVGGLTSSTISALIAIPVIYFHTISLGKKIWQKIAQSKVTSKKM